MSKIILRPYQQECIDAIPDEGSYLVQMATGLGKCFARGTKILMHDGSIKNVEDIKQGELVMGVDSQPRAVKGLARGTEEMFEISPTKGDPYTVNKSHILSLKITNIGRKRVSDNRGNKYKAGDIVNISVRDYLECSKTFKHVAKGWRVGVDFDWQWIEIPPYILGLWLGDGTSGGAHITNTDAEVLSELKMYCDSNNLAFKRVPSSKGKASTYSITSIAGGWGANVFRNGLRKYKLLNNKHIPMQYLTNSRYYRLELLAGLIDTDGHNVDGCVLEVATKSKQLNKDILYLARSLGFAAYSNKKIVKGRTYYRINISGDTHLIPLRVERKRAQKRRQIKDVCVTGIKVKSIGRGEYFGFELEGSDKLFLLGDFTVVHNTVTFSKIPTQGRMLILSHRAELVKQPLKYFDCQTGIEMARHTSLPSDEVVSASVQSLANRLDRFSGDEFDIIITDECHHAGARTYKKIYSHFKPRLHLGFTATPNRADRIRLDDVFEDIIFERDLQWGIKNKYLSDIYCRRVNIGYDLSAVRSRAGDYMPGELDKAMDGTADAIADAYYKLAEGATLIFAVSVEQAEEIAKRIDGAVAVTGKTKNRQAIIDAFSRREIPCLVNCMVFTEGTDIPLIETIIIARPTQSDALYTQMVGRGLRLSEGKERLNLIDCVGVTGKASLCTAPSLLGIDLDNVPMQRQEELEGLIFEMPEKAKLASDCPESWVKNIEIVNLWAKGQKYNTHNVNWFKMPNGDMVCNLREGKRLTIPCPDSLGRTTLRGETVTMQEALDRAYAFLASEYMHDQYIWDLSAVKRWGKAPASDKQIRLIERRLRGYDASELNKMEASQILNRIMTGGRAV